MADHPAVGLTTDLFRSREELLAENAFLRRQVMVLHRKVPHPKLTTLDRLALVLGAGFLTEWRRALMIVQPDTILRWHRDQVRLFWQKKSKPKGTVRRGLAKEKVALIREMAKENRSWGAERIRGELLKLDIKVAKRTIQKYMAAVRQRSPHGQKWSTFLKNHAHVTWCCDFLQTYDALFRPLFAFFIVHLGSRRVVHIATTRNPTEEWTAQELRNATMDNEPPKYLIRDRDDKFGGAFTSYGGAFDRVAKGGGIKVIKTAVRAPDMNAVMERFLRSARGDALDHFLVTDEVHLYRVLREYQSFFNRARPHQGIGQRVPAGSTATTATGNVIRFPVLGGLHHDYRRAA